MKTRRWMLGAAACLALLLSACGQDGRETSASSFSSVRNAPATDPGQGVPPESENPQAAGNYLKPTASAKPSPVPDSAPASAVPAAPSPAASSAPALEPTQSPAAFSRSAPTSKAPAESPSAAGKKKISSPERSSDAQAPAGGKAHKSRSAALETAGAAPSDSAPSPARKSAVSPPPSAAAGSGGAPVPSAPASPPPAKSGTGARGGVTDAQGTVQIGWSEFFDGGDQTRPSERFWDLSESGSKVSIKGFMGEVLSFEKRWFLLIPEPGAECPFDNGDETYWNKIMIVFVPNDAKLRHKSGLLRITGRLEVGIKIDESGYKTMFRLYDASFEEVTE